jgi:hypothetical protein
MRVDLGERFERLLHNENETRLGVKSLPLLSQQYSYQCSVAAISTQHRPCFQASAPKSAGLLLVVLVLRLGMVRPRNAREIAC